MSFANLSQPTTKNTEPLDDDVVITLEVTNVTEANDRDPSILETLC
jgi:hypothetical protein